MLFSVQDTSTGILSHEIHRIFEKFHRVHDQRGRSYPGTGIGLSLTQELVKLHGGKLDVESGQGATFSIQIPVAVVISLHRNLFAQPTMQTWRVRISIQGVWAECC
jgi:signal transduction histidine kinase